LWLKAIVRELLEHRMYQALLRMSPGLEERLNTGSEQDVHYVADMVSVYPIDWPDRSLN
jgi:hypothetical protein